MNEEELISLREKNEYPVIHFFNVFSMKLFTIIEQIKKKIAVGKITSTAGQELLLHEIIDLQLANDKAINLILEEYISRQYQLGIDSIELDIDRTITSRDLVVIYLLYRTLKRYTGKTIKDIYNKAMKGKVSNKYIANRFKTVLITEGTRHISAAQLSRIAASGYYLQYVTYGDETVCPICRPYHGKIYYPWDAYGLLPQHPMCRCYYKVNKWEDYI